MRLLTLSAGLLLAATFTQAQLARVQVIHNCADLGAAQVDVYLDNILLLDDFAFRTASPFIDAPAGVQFTVGIAPSTSISSADAIYTEDFTLVSGETYVIVASGIISPTGYMPATPFSLQVNAMGREAANGGMMMTDVLVMHGSTDAPTVDVYENALVNATIVDDASYGDFAGYLELGTDDYELQVRDGANSTIVAAYSAPLSTLNLGGQALVVLASGFLDPTMNSNGPAFGLWAALAAGGPLVELPAAAIPTARVQVIHNSADLAAAQVDVWLNNTLLLDDLAFRTSSPFVDAQAGVPFDVSVSLPTSTDTIAALARYTYTLVAGETYLLVANGIVSPSGYSPVQPFNIYVQPMGRETSNMAGEVDVLVFHGATDAPTVDVVETAIPAGIIVDDISYGEFAGYLELAELDYVLDVEASGTVVASYQAPLATLGLAGNAITIFASGFLDPTMNSNGPAFGLWVSLPAGGPLVELPPISTSVGENENIGSFVAYPNPITDQLWLEMDLLKEGRTSVVVQDAVGRVVRNLDLGLLPTGNSRININMIDLENGAYFMTVQNGSGSLTFPVQKR